MQSIRLFITYHRVGANINRLSRASALECLHLFDTREARLQNWFIIVMRVLEAKESYGRDREQIVSGVSEKGNLLAASDFAQA